MSREGLLGKACQALVSPGVVPNTPEVWDLLRQKHPRGPHPSLPISSSPPVNHVLPHDSIQEHWKDDNITVCKVDMSNAFNLVSRQALLEECAVHFTELLPWVGWCYGSHPTLWHPLGQLSSETGVQQGDPLGPLLFSLVLHKLVLSIAQDKDCLSLLSNRWYLDDGVLSGHSQAVTRAVTLIQEMGPSLGLFINVSKCELFGHGDLSSFPPEMKVSQVPNLEILGAPIGDPIFCATNACRCSETPIPIGRSLNLHLEPNEFQVAIKWWLGMDVSFGSCCPYCPNHRLDPLGHHALTCKHGGDVVLRHNSLRDVVVESCHRACLGGQVEVGSGLGLDRLHSRPADIQWVFDYKTTRL
ncbi:hypothetical protein EMCRGX_G000261 [Ephydatia muelleri]